MDQRRPVRNGVNAQGSTTVAQKHKLNMLRTAKLRFSTRGWLVIVALLSLAFCVLGPEVQHGLRIAHLVEKCQGIGGKAMIVLCPHDEYSRPLLWFKATLIAMGFQYSTSMVGAVDLQGLDLCRVDLKKIVEPLPIRLLVLDHTELCYDTLRNCSEITPSDRLSYWLGAGPWRFYHECLFRRAGSADAAVV
jgi:hypothetical protein